MSANRVCVCVCVCPQYFYTTDNQMNRNEMWQVKQESCKWKRNEQMCWKCVALYFTGQSCDRWSSEWTSNPTFQLQILAEVSHTDLPGLALKTPWNEKQKTSRFAFFNTYQSSIFWLLLVKFRKHRRTHSPGSSANGRRGSAPAGLPVGGWCY